MPLRFFNTLTKKKELFVPLEDRKVRIFVCGVTVYDYAHLGHARTYAFYDSLVRFLKYLGYKVIYLQNVTDVGHLLDTGEDRLIKKAREEKKDPMEIAEFYFKHWLEMMEKLKLQRPDLLPRATDHIKEIIAQVKTLIRNGFAYESNGSVYFEVKKFKDYGKLSKMITGELISGARVKLNPDKKDPADFALWIKATPDHILNWESPWGLGYPGWHIEDTAIAIKYFGPQYDIHGGAIELAFPHHEAEIAQAEGTTGIKSYVKYWIHSGLLTINKEKMAKSKGNFITIADALKKFDPEVIRMWIASTNYRKPLDYNEKDLQNAKKKVGKIRTTLMKIEEIRKLVKAKKPNLNKKLLKLKKKFLDSLSDDFNSPLALSYYLEILSILNKAIDKGKITRKDLKMGEELIQELGSIFQFVPEIRKEKIPKEVKELMEKRNKARLMGDFKTADEIREKIKSLGYEIEDTKKETRIKKR